MTRTLMVIAIVACVANSLAQIGAGNLTEEGILGKAGEAVFSAGELRKVLSLIDPESRKALADNPSALNESVRSLLLERLVLGEAAKVGWEQRESVVVLIEKAREQVILQTFLAEVSALPDGALTDDQIRSVYEAKKESLTTPKRYRLSRIFVPRPGPGSSISASAARSKVGQVVDALANPNADFKEIARELSEEPQIMINGGEIGWFRAAQLNLEIRDAIANLKPGERTGVIELEDGWHIVKLLEENEPRALEYEEVKPAIEEQLRGQLVAARRRAYLAKLLEDNPIAVNELGMATVIEQSENFDDATVRGSSYLQPAPNDREPERMPFRFRASKDEP